jgi:hypothetical protein
MMASWRTIRLRNADGTSSVYKVHDGVNMHDHDVFSSPSMSSASLPEVIFAGGGSIQHAQAHPHSPVSASLNTTSSSYYGQNTLFSAHTQPHGQSPMVVLNSTKKRKKKVSTNCANKCNTTNSPLCITFGVILSLLVIIGYVCLIVFLIPGSTKSRWNEQDVLSSTATTVTPEGGDGSNHSQQQPSKQHLMQNDILFKDSSSPMMTRSSSSAIDGAGIPSGRSYNAIVTILDPADAPQQVQSSQLLRKVANNRVSRKSDDAGELVRRLRRRKRKQKMV